MSRASSYTSAIADTILSQLLAGCSLTVICADPGMPPRRTIEQWVHDDRDGFGTRFRAARKIAGAKGGGPTVYTPEVADWILDGLMSGRSLAAVCRDPGMPTPSTVRNWAEEDREGFAGRYRLAREIGYEVIADEIIDIADNCPTMVIERHRRDGTIKLVAVRGNVAHARLRIKTRKWWLSKMLPRRYGNRPNLLERIEMRDTPAELMKQIERRNREAAEQGQADTPHRPGLEPAPGLPGLSLKHGGDVFPQPPTPGFWVPAQGRDDARCGGERHEGTGSVNTPDTS